MSPFITATLEPPAEEPKAEAMAYDPIIDIEFTSLQD